MPTTNGSSTKSNTKLFWCAVVFYFTFHNETICNRSIFCYFLKQTFKILLTTLSSILCANVISDKVSKQFPLHENK